jgi:predicted transcriptional regulator
MAKRQKSERPDSAEPRRIFSVRLAPSLIERVSLYATLSKQSHQQIAEAALEKYLREAKFTAEKARELKKMLGT